MRRLALYPRALYSLERQVQVYHHQKLRIDVIELPPPNRQQASIKETLSAVLNKPTDAVAREEELIRVAAKRVHPGSSNQAYRYLISEDEEARGKWKESFPGTVHCAAYLPCVMIKGSTLAVSPPYEGDSLTA